MLEVWLGQAMLEVWLGANNLRSVVGGKQWNSPCKTLLVLGIVFCVCGIFCRP